MPGKPKTAALVAHLREEVDGQARVEYIFELIAGGQTLTEAVRGIELVYKGELWAPDRATVSEVLHKHWPEELKAARASTGGFHSDEQLLVLKNAPETKEGIAKARELAAAHRWLASKRDPANYGDTPATAIQINNPGQLFLQ